MKTGIYLKIVLFILLTLQGSLIAEENIPPAPEMRIIRSDQGIEQLPDEKMQWLLDAKFGMFIHWGLYAVPARSEWYMENQGIKPDEYRKYAYPDKDGKYFDAADFHPDQWAKLANDAGMKWMCLTARHHDGFSLFDSPHPNAFTSVQTIKRDLIAEYTTACRNSGLKVGIYYSPLSWRYPGYYDVTGTDCAKNKFGYTTDPSHKENARLMKEENYVNVRQLLTQYGKIDHIFWDGGWLGQHGSDADAAYFHEPGKYLDPQNQWPVDKKYWDLEESTKKPLGIMGMVRKYQPDAITNLRYGWIGDIKEEEGGADTKGPIRNREIVDKCMTIQNGGWGINAGSIQKGNVISGDRIIRHLADCVIRNMTLLLNVTPDMHGVIPEIEQKRLLEVGEWLKTNGDAIYQTRGGPWQPVDRQYGFTYKQSTIYLHLLDGFKEDHFKMPQLGELRVKTIRQLASNKLIEIDDPRSPTIKGFDRAISPPDTIIAFEYDQEIKSIWGK